MFTARERIIASLVLAVVLICTSVMMDRVGAFFLRLLAVLFLYGGVAAIVLPFTPKRKLGIGLCAFGLAALLVITMLATIPYTPSVSELQSMPWAQRQMICRSADSACVLLWVFFTIGITCAPWANRKKEIRNENSTR